MRISLALWQESSGALWAQAKTKEHLSLQVLTLGLLRSMKEFGKEQQAKQKGIQIGFDCFQHFIVPF